jgi:ribosomal protein S18 acetylase RimI-like enzyme
VSNFLGRSNASASSPQYRPARPDEIHSGIRLILGPDGGLADSEQAMEFCSLAHQRGINLGDLWIAEREGRLLWAVLPIVSPGRTVLLLCPASRSKDEIMGALIDAICARFAQRGTHLAQALLDPPDAAGQRLFASHGFRRMAELVYLQGNIPTGMVEPTLPPGFAWQHYAPHTHALFAQAIADSYRDSLDCPGLNGLRDIDDVIAGHKGSGEFDPRFWSVLTEHGAGRGVLLLSRLAKIDAAELVYLGLAPDARRRGLGQLLMNQALYVTTEQMQLSRLSLAVPALKLNYRFGFSKAGSKVAMMRVLGR